MWARRGEFDRRSLRRWWWNAVGGQRRHELLFRQLAALDALLGNRYFKAPDPPVFSVQAMLPGIGLAMQVLAGEPAIALTSSIAIACLALTTRANPLGHRVRRLAVVATFAALLSAVGCHGSPAGGVGSLPPV